jgi:membrane protein
MGAQYARSHVDLHPARAVTSPALATKPPLERAFRLSARVVRGMYVHNAFEAAAAAAFWFFLSLIPLLVLAGFLVGQVARTRGVDALVGPLLDVVPTTAEAIMRKEVERLAGAGASSLAPLGVAGYLWTASSGLHNLMDVFETAAQVKPRAWWKQRGIALGWVLVGLATMCLLASLLVQIDSALRDHNRRPAIHARDVGALRHSVHGALYAPNEQVIAAALTLVVGMALLGGFYRFAVEHPARVRRHVWPGTVIAVACWLVVSWGFGAYVVSIADYALYYGSLAAVAVLLVWLYLTTLSLVVGAEVNAHLERVGAGLVRGERGRPSRAAAP